METCDVAIIGAGPYGLSAAAHLRPLKGLDTLVFGEPMSFWERSMPAGMRLLSPSATCHIADPANRLNLDIYRELNTRNSENHDLQDHLQVADFIKYGHWFHQEAGVRADRRKVVRVDLASKGYQVTLEDGETLRAGRVVVAGGIQPFVHRPKVFEGLPSSLVAHTSEQYEYGKFRDKEVLVIGGGRSSIEAAVFLREAGAHVEVLIRNAGIGSPNPTLDWLKSRSWISIFYGKGGVGPPGISHIVQRPNLYRRLPRSTQDSWDKRATRTKFIYHHLPGPHNISVHRGRSIVQARIEGDRLRLRLNDGVERTVDHVVLGTGYCVNVGLYKFLSPLILKRLDVADGYPRLDSGFETSLAGLHFLGAPAAWSFGPLMRFVAGTEFASRALKQRILRAQKR